MLFHYSFSRLCCLLILLITILMICSSICYVSSISPSLMGPVAGWLFVWWALPLSVARSIPYLQCRDYNSGWVGIEGALLLGREGEINQLLFFFYRPRSLMWLVRGHFDCRSGLLSVVMVVFELSPRDSNVLTNYHSFCS